MSDAPGNKPRPNDRRRGERSRNRHRNNRRPQQSEQPKARDDDRRPPGAARPEKRRRDRQRHPKKPAPAAARMTLRQKLLAIFTFGLVRPKSGRKPAPQPDARPPRPPRGPTTPVPPADPDAITTQRLHVGNLHNDASEDDLMDLFKGIGPVRSTDIVYSGRTYRSKGCGFVEFLAVSDAKRAVEELHGLPFMGRALILGPARSRGDDAREADDPPTEGDRA